MARNTEKSLESLADSAADRAIRRMKADDADISGFDHLTQLDADDGIDHQSEGDKVTNFDIFDHCDDLVTKGQHQIKYEIKKNGEMLTTRYHPYSWERLQKDYKGGHYQVSAKSLTTKRFVKHETRSLADVPHNIEEDNDLPRQRIVETQTPQGPSFMELFALMNGQSEKQQAAAREAQREAQSSNQGTMLAFVEMMKSSQMQSQTMFMEIAKMTQSVSEKLAESQRIMAEKMESRFEKIVEKLSEKKQDNGMSITELMSLQQAAQEKGFALFNKMATLAEAKTEERLALIEDARDERDSRADRGKKSLTDSLIESVLPTVASALAGQAAASAQPAQPTPQQQIRRSLPQGYTNSQGTAQAAQSRPRTAIRQAQARPTSNVKEGQREGGASRGANGSGNGIASAVTNDLGLPSANFAAETSDVVLTPTNTSTVTKHDIEQILTPIFGACLIERKDPPVAAVDIEAALSQNGIDRPTFLQTVSKEDMMGIVKGYELPVEAQPWFEEVYAHIQNAARVDAGEHATS